MIARDTKVIDVIKTPQFKHNVKAYMKEIEFCLRVVKILDRHPDIKSKRSLVEKLQEKNAFNSRSLILLYTKSITENIDTDKYSPELKSFIEEIGNEAFIRTVVELENNR